MTKGVRLQLNNSSGTPLPNLSGIVALWWDSNDETSLGPVRGRTATATTDASGYISLDISAVSKRSIGQTGFLVLHLPDLVDHKASRTFQSRCVIEDVTTTSALSADGDWVRPADWLTMPTVLGTDHKFVGLYAVQPNVQNHLALSAKGEYSVDWGDGSAPETFLSGVTAEHTYNYSAAALVGTECSRGYRQALVTVTMQSGQTFSEIALNVRHSATSQSIYNVPWLDMTIAGAALANIRIGSASGSSLQVVRLATCERVKILSHATANMQYMFSNCHRLQSVDVKNSSVITNMTAMFSNCSSLRTAPELTPTSCTAFASMFQNCPSLLYVPPYTIPAGSVINSMFNACYSLSEIPQINATNSTNLSGFTQNSFALRSVPALDLSSATSLANAFSGCPSLESFKATGMKVSFSVIGCSLSAAALNEIYTNLATVTGQTITVTSNAGVSGHNPSIATAKGWTVTV